MSFTPESPRTPAPPIEKVYSNIFERAIGMMHTESEYTPDNRSVKEYAKLISKAKELVEIDSGELYESIYLSPALEEVIQQAIKNGVVIDVLAGPYADPGVIKKLLSMGANVRGTEKKLGRSEVVTIDLEHMRVQVPGKGRRSSYEQTIIRKAPHADSVSRGFREQFWDAVVLTPDTITSWQDEAKTKTP